MSNKLSKKITFFLGVFSFLILAFFPMPNFLDQKSWQLLAILALMILWWIGEVVPIAVTALAPLVLMPLFGILPLNSVASNYSNQIIFLFLGGFSLSLALQKWDLHLRIALNIVKLTGSKAKNILAGFMITTAFISMWMSNTASTLVMLPIAISVLELLKADKLLDSESQKRFSAALLLSIAFSANIGGVATLIGTPPNIILAAFLEKQLGYKINFAKWLMIGLPFSLISLFVAWFLLKKFFGLKLINEIKGSDLIIKKQLLALGKMKYEEKMVAIIFTLAATMWVFHPLLNIPGLNDTIIAIIILFVLFAFPIKFKTLRFLLKWEDSKNLPWGIILLFGSGFSLAMALKESDILLLLERLTRDSNLTYVLMVFLTIFLIKIIGELMSNVASVSIMLPLVAAIATSYDQNPLFLIIAAALASSCDFMLPIATPPNAIIFSSKSVHVNDMMKVGGVMDLVIILLASFFALLFLPAIL